jgi:hypothetical protein
MNTLRKCACSIVVGVCSGVIVGIALAVVIADRVYHTGEQDD